MTNYTLSFLEKDRFLIYNCYFTRRNSGSPNRSKYRIVSSCQRKRTY